MKLKYIIIVFVFIFFFSSCAKIGRHAITYANSIKKKKELTLYGYGAGRHDNIPTIDIYFMYFKPLDIEKARQLFVTTVEGLLKQINTDPSLESFFGVYPATYKNTNIVIHFHKKGTLNYFDDGHVALMYYARGMIYYATCNPSTGILEDLHTEPYIRAKNIVLKTSDPEEPPPPPLPPVKHSVIFVG